MRVRKGKRATFSRKASNIGVRQPDRLFAIFFRSTLYRNDYVSKLNEPQYCVFWVKAYPKRHPRSGWANLFASLVPWDLSLQEALLDPVRRAAAESAASTLRRGTVKAEEVGLIELLSCHLKVFRIYKVNHTSLNFYKYL